MTIVEREAAQQLTKAAPLAVVVIIFMGVNIQAPITASSGLHQINHVLIIMEENRSFDSYFGTYPGADGIPMQNGVPTVCVPNRITNAYEKPYHDIDDLNHGGPMRQTLQPLTLMEVRWVDSFNNASSKSIAGSTHRPLSA